MLIAFDTETTGLQPGWNEIIELGAIVLDPNTLVPVGPKFECKLLIKHFDRVEPGTLGVVNHYDPDVWNREALEPVDALVKFADWMMMVSHGGLHKPMFLGHNAAFDTEFLDRWCLLYGNIMIHRDHHKIDTVTVFRFFREIANLAGRSLGLPEYAKCLAVVNPKAHGALADAATSGLCYALTLAYLKAMIECGRYSHEQLLDEAWYRIGHPRRQGYNPLPQRESVLLPGDRT